LLKVVADHSAGKPAQVLFNTCWHPQHTGSNETLGKASAKIIAAESVKLGAEMLGRGELDVYATNKAILSEMSDKMPGSRILDGNWGFEHMAVAIPKGREQALPFVGNFVREMQTSGHLAQLQSQAGLRGAVKAEP